MENAQIQYYVQNITELQELSNLNALYKYSVKDNRQQSVSLKFIMQPVVIDLNHSILGINHK